MEKTNDGKKGGWLVGKRHYDKSGKPIGGIPAVVGDSKRPVELEGGEVIINREASKKYWRELSKINQSAGNGVPIKPQDVGADEDPEEYKEGGKVIEFNPNRLPNRRIYNYAKSIKEKYPKVWGLGGNIFGNEAFKNLERVIKRGYWTDNEEWMYIKWRSFVARHKGDFRIAGVIAMLKWVDKVDKGWEYMKNLIEAEIDKRYPKKKKGGAVVTYKNKYNKKYGYDKNESHDLSEISKDTGVSKKGLQQIYNKGVGAFNTNPQSVRPNVKSEEQWAMGRVYSAVMGGKAARVDAKELKMETGGNLYHLGGDMSKHLAPNGEPSNLTHEQWHLVRTPEFKAWFGDWENSPETSSKVVDENGEPLVVYRGLQKNTDYKRTGLQYFAYDYDYAKMWSKNNGGVGNVISVFLSIKNPLNFEEYNKKLFHYGIDAGWRNKKEGLLQISDELERGQPYISQIGLMDVSGADDLAENFMQDLKTCDGYFGYDAGYYGEQFVFVTKEPTQIKLADGTNTTFDGRNADIRYEDGGSVENLISEGIVDLKMYDTTPEHAKEYGLKSINPLYIQTIYVSEPKRLKGLGKKVLAYIEKYAIKNGHDVVFGHITKKAKFTKDESKTSFRDIDMIKNWLYSNGYAINNNNNDFHKVISHNNSDIRYAGGGELAKGIKTEQEHKDTLEKIASGEITVNQAIKMTAKDHLKENPKYYTELAKIENYADGGDINSVEYGDIIRMETSLNGVNLKLNFKVTSNSMAINLLTRDAVSLRGKKFTLVSSKSTSKQQELPKSTSKQKPQVSPDLAGAVYKIGDIVEVVDTGKRYGTYKEKFIELGFNNTRLNNRLVNGDICKVFGITHDDKRVQYGVTKIGGDEQGLFSEKGLKKLNKYDVGDEVIITNDGYIFTTWDVKFKELGFDNEFENDNLVTNNICKVFGISAYSDQGVKIIYGINNNKYEGLIGEEGIRLTTLKDKKEYEKPVTEENKVTQEKPILSTEERTWNEIFNVGDKVKVRADFSNDLGNGASGVDYNSQENNYEIIKVVKLNDIKRNENPSGRLYTINNNQNWEGKDLELIQKGEPKIIQPQAKKLQPLNIDFMPFLNNFITNQFENAQEINKTNIQTDVINNLLEEIKTSNDSSLKGYVKYLSKFKKD